MPNVFIQLEMFEFSYYTRYNNNNNRFFLVGTYTDNYYCSYPPSNYFSLNYSLVK